MKVSELQSDGSKVRGEGDCGQGRRLLRKSLGRKHPNPRKHEFTIHSVDKTESFVSGHRDSKVSKVGSLYMKGL